MYGCEAWVLTKSTENKLEVWERKMLRAIFGGTRTRESIWRQRTNAEIKKMYGNFTIQQYVKAQRLRWLGHVYRMPECRDCRRTLVKRDGGRRGRSRRK